MIKKGCKEKKHKKILIIDGKRYYLKDTAYNKVDAEQVKNNFKNKGLNVHINIRTGKCFGYGEIPKYGVYTRTRRN